MRHPPSRATVIRLIGVSDLKLRWADIPGHPEPPASEAPSPAESPRPRAPLNCLLAPSYDPLALHAELTIFLQGAGGYIEQTHAYLEPGSIAAYQRLCRSWLLEARLRSLIPLAEIVQQITSVSGGAPLQLLALGTGDGRAETQLAGHLIEAGISGLELCLLDINPALLTSAYHYAGSRLAALPQVHIWAIQGNLHHLPLYAALRRPSAQPRRLSTLLGETLAHLDHEPRFVQQSLLETQRPVPGNYALHAIATITSSQRAERRFSVFRITRYDFPQLIQCLRGLGWEELGAEIHGGDHALQLYRKV